MAKKGGRMKILQVHNYYKIPGGEDQVVANEKRLLEENGHEVYTYYRQNSTIDQYSKWQKIKLIKDTTWSSSSYADFDKLLGTIKPDICHVHNFMPLITPAVYSACQAHKIPVAQTLHNYRLICTNGLFMRDGNICEDCLSKSPYGAVKKKCYRDSYLQTYAVARMLDKHTKRKTWQDNIDAYFCLTEFAKSKFISHGLPEQKLHVKPNFVELNESRNKIITEDYLVYVGRLESNKGIEIFSQIAQDLAIPLKVVGNGPLIESIRNLPNIEVLGALPHQSTLDLISGAKALIFPSLSYEGMPMTILEAFSLKTPVVSSNIGAMKTIINHQQNGLLFDSNSAEDLLDKIKLILGDNGLDKNLTQAAFEDYKNNYSKTANYKLLIDTYTQLIK